MPCPGKARLKILKVALKKKEYERRQPTANERYRGRLLKPILDAAKPYLRIFKSTPSDRLGLIKDIRRKWRYCNAWLARSRKRRKSVLRKNQACGIPSAAYAEHEPKISWKRRTSEAFATSTPRSGKIYILDACAPVRYSVPKMHLRTSEALLAAGHDKDRIIIVEKDPGAAAKISSLAKKQNIALVEGLLDKAINECNGKIGGIYADFYTSDPEAVKHTMRLFFPKATKRACFGFTLTGRNNKYLPPLDDRTNEIKKWASKHGFREKLGKGHYSQGNARTVILVRSCSNE